MAICPITGIFKYRYCLPTTGTSTHCAPTNATEPWKLPNFEVFPAGHLNEVCAHLAQKAPITAYTAPSTSIIGQYNFDLAMLKANFAHDVP